MYMVFRCVTPDANSTEIGYIEFATVLPNNLDNDQVYAEVSAENAVRVNRILTNVDGCVINKKVRNLSNRKINVIGSSDISLPTSPKTDRKIPAEGDGAWNDTVRPAWYRLVATTDHYNL